MQCSNTLETSKCFLYLIVEDAAWGCKSKMQSLSIFVDLPVFWRCSFLWISYLPGVYGNPSLCQFSWKSLFPSSRGGSPVVFEIVKSGALHSSIAWCMSLFILIWPLLLSFITTFIAFPHVVIAFPCVHIRYHSLCFQELFGLGMMSGSSRGSHGAVVVFRCDGALTACGREDCVFCAAYLDVDPFVCWRSHLLHGIGCGVVLVWVILF